MLNVVGPAPDRPLIDWRWRFYSDARKLTRDNFRVLYPSWQRKWQSIDGSKGPTLIDPQWTDVSLSDVADLYDKDAPQKSRKQLYERCDTSILHMFLMATPRDEYIDFLPRLQRSYLSTFRLPQSI